MEEVKKVKRAVAMFIFMLCLSGCIGEYASWKEIELQAYGKIKIPEGWLCHIQDNKIYFTDEGITELTEDNVHLAGYIYEEGDELGAVYKMFDENASYEGHIKGEVFQIVHAEG